MDSAEPARPLVPDRPDLERRLGIALGIARRAIPLLASDWEDAPADAPAFRREKFICETALLLYAAAPACKGSPALGERLREVAEALAPRARSADVVATMQLCPYMACELSVGHLCLDAIGVPDRDFDTLLAGIVAEDHPVPEMAPWKDLEGDWVARRRPCFRRLPDLDRSIARTGFARGIDVLMARREEFYAFTHALLYLCDFGRVPITPPRPAGQILSEAEAALAGRLDEDDFDLCAELLLTWPYLRQPLSASARFCLAVMCRLEDEVGFLPALGMRLGELRKKPRDRLRSLFDRAYHTAYTMGFLAAALLLAPPVPAADGAGGPPGAAARLRRLLPATRGSPQWEASFATLAAHEQDELAPLLASIGIKRALAAHDLARIRDILDLCVELRLGPGAAFRQAASLLRRFTPVPVEPSATSTLPAASVPALTFEPVSA